MGWEKVREEWGRGGRWKMERGWKGGGEVEMLLFEKVI